MSQNSLFSFPCCYPCSPCFASNVNKVNRKPLWNREEPWWLSHSIVQPVVMRHSHGDPSHWSLGDTQLVISYLALVYSWLGLLSARHYWFSDTWGCQPTVPEHSLFTRRIFCSLWYLITGNAIEQLLFPNWKMWQMWCGVEMGDLTRWGSAKYGAYTMFCNTILKVVHFELLQVNANVFVNLMF